MAFVTGRWAASGRPLAAMTVAGNLASREGLAGVPKGLTDEAG